MPIPTLIRSRFSCAARKGVGNNEGEKPEKKY